MFEHRGESTIVNGLRPTEQLVNSRNNYVDRG